MTPAAADAPPALLSARGVAVHYPVRRGVVRAVDGVDLDVLPGKTLALVGESGCGKSTLGRALLQLVRPTAGGVSFAGQALQPLWRRRLGRWQWGPALRALRRRMQPIFQDPFASLDPRMTVAASIGEPLDAFGLARGRVARADAVAALLAEVGLAPQHAGRYPHAFSGGQRQRIVIARALALRPDLIVADEPIAALDVSIQAQILNLLRALQAAHRIAYVFISHDLAAVAHMADAVAVMYLGRVVERAPTAALLARPRHPYTAALWAAVPVADPAQARARPPAALAGEVPSPLAPPPGCAFHPRCPRRIARCAAEAPALRTVAPDHAVACHVAE